MVLRTHFSSSEAWLSIEIRHATVVLFGVYGCLLAEQFVLQLKLYSSTVFDSSLIIVDWLLSYTPR